MKLKPSLILDPNRCKSNIARITQKAKDHGLDFRPHFKTHQSKEVGRWFRNEGINGITVSSVDMAKYFTEDGWSDITIAFPFYSGMIEGLKELESTTKLRLFLNDEQDIQRLNRELNNPFKIYIEIDAGYGRSGVSHNDYGKIEYLMKAAEEGELSKFHGFYIHDGGTYKARSIEEIKSLILDSHSALKTLKERYPDAATSLGDTPSASVLKSFEGIDEITPGNLVFYDWMQVQIGSCRADDVAVWVEVPFAQEISGNKAIVHSGAVHFSKDYILYNERKNFGQVVHPDSEKLIPKENCFLSALSQEHGTVSGFSKESIQENGSIRVLPIHSCLTANLFDKYITPDGKTIEKRVLS
ncbi:alanine racemase [Rhodohalobacter halophilus]|uniref:alanine racemase n=1 Tax=Rhodohalobacter halophilus TaxID=1812810 RepID=UPI00083F70BA|nr:alanine racemase [Rhodohalobacter halophilus]